MPEQYPGRANAERNADDAHYERLAAERDEPFIVRFFVLAGKFAVAKTETFPTMQDAENAVRAYAEAAGYSNVKCIDDGEELHVRWTAKTPNGRSGRNVADCDLPCMYEDTL